MRDVVVAGMLKVSGHDAWASKVSQNMPKGRRGLRMMINRAPNYGEQGTMLDKSNVIKNERV
mgnify:FL=1